MNPALEALTKVPLSNGNAIYYRTVDGTAFRVRMDLADGTTDERAAPDEVIEILNRYRGSETLLRIFLGHEDGASWLEENDIVGTIGRSCGQIKVPLLVPPGHRDGPAILTDCIIRIDTARRTLWQHPNFHLPEIELTTGDLLHLPYEVKVDGKVHARFYTDTERQHWLKLLRGDRFPSRSEDPGAYGLDRG